jgi:translation initiation factor IF-3
MDYGKFKFEKCKRAKEADKKSAATEMKMVRLKPVTSVHDRDVLIRHTDRFLRHGHKVRVICRFQGRQNAHPEIGRAQLEFVADSLAPISGIEGPIIKQGRDMIMNLSPKAGVKPLPKVAKEDWKQTRKDGEAENDEDAEFEALQKSIMGDDLDDEAANADSNLSATPDNAEPAPKAEITVGDREASDTATAVPAEDAAQG